MPKRTDIKSVLIIGAGPIVIGQAWEFDYSGARSAPVHRPVKLSVRKAIRLFWSTAIRRPS